MSESRRSTFRELWKPKIVKIGGALAATLAGYDAASNQLGLVKIGEVLGMSGTLLPWWGWLLVLQAVFVYALFEYVRRIQIPTPAYDDADLRGAIEALAAGVANLQAKWKESDAAFDKLRYDHDSFRANFDPAIEQMLAPCRDEIREGQARVKAVISDYQNVLGKLVLLEAAEKVRVSTQEDFQAKMEAWVGNLQRRIRLGFMGIDQGFVAIRDRERMLDLVARISEVRDELSGPTEGEAITDRNGWLAKFIGWRRNVDAWAHIAEKYCAGAVERVFATPDEEYRGEWKATDDLFPNSIAVHDYKTFRIISRNFYAELEKVQRTLELAAFAHPSQKVRVDPEGLDDNEPPSPPPPPKVKS